jgi:hypothetical protein
LDRRLTMENVEIGRVLSEVGDLLEIQGATLPPS